METEFKGFEILEHKFRGANRQKALEKFADKILELNKETVMKYSSRGWCYFIEGEGLIDKSQFDNVQKFINECRSKGLLPIDMVEVEVDRRFNGILIPDRETPQEYLESIIDYAANCETTYIPDYWENEEYYIQMVVEKSDVKNFFEPICKEYNIPIATAKGWSSKLMRAEFARRFKEAENDGLKCVLLYCGDHDPDGLRISNTLRNNLKQLQKVKWKDGESGYNPENLIIDRFGLNYEFIIKNNLLWINNLITSSGKNLANPKHKNHKMKYVQDYIIKFGVRKCEANSITKRGVAKASEKLCRDTIEKYLGKDAIDRFTEIRYKRDKMFKEFRTETGLDNAIKEVKGLLEENN